MWEGVTHTWLVFFYSKDSSDLWCIKYMFLSSLQGPPADLENHRTTSGGVTPFIVFLKTYTGCCFNGSSSLQLGMIYGKQSVRGLFAQHTGGGGDTAAQR